MKISWGISICTFLMLTLTSATASTARSVLSYGTYIDRCVIPGTVALTFDDGPFWFTADLLQILSEYGAPATFFLNGHNLGDVYASSDVVQRIVNEGHQLGSHTYFPGVYFHLYTILAYCLTSWGHPYLTILDYPTIVAQMTQLEAAFEEIVGFVPVYMRPPYLALNGVVHAAMADLGYHIIGASIDTKDFENDNPELIMNSVAKFKAELGDGDIVLAHDVHEQTVYTLAREMLEEIFARGLQRMAFLFSFCLDNLLTGIAVTVGDCLGDPEEFWYR